MSASKDTPPTSLDSESFSGDDSSSNSFSTLLGDNPPSNENQIPVVMIHDSEEIEHDFENLSEEDRNVPIYKTYKTFSTEAHTHGFEYTTLPAIERFRRSTPVSSPASEQLIILGPCQKDELICLSTLEQGSSTPFTYMGSGSMSDLLVGEDGTPHFSLFWSLESRRVSGFKFDQLSFDEKIDVAFLRNQAPIDCGFLLENEDLPARLR
ncbi:Acetyl-CoA carboxylase [Sesbania bispinosa]|nr:Acetyl-CoA carboxylase [Sesbania bispinosa]